MSRTKLQEELEKELFTKGSFDFKLRPFCIGGRQAICTYVIGFCDSGMLERIFYSLLSLPREPLATMTAEEFQEKYLPFPATEVIRSTPIAAREVLRGGAFLTVEGVEGGILLDARSFTSRGVEEPEKDRSLRGPHLGLNENMVTNLVQIRRYLRTKELRTERFLLGERVQNEVTMLYLAGRCDETLADRIRRTLTEKKIPALSMTQETLADLLFPQKGLRVLNPFPRVRYTERPDVVAATLMEGKIALICDNSPSVMLLPECLFDFFEETDDYYFPPLTASYLRIVRLFVFFTSIFLIPVWLVLVRHSASLPDGVRFLLAEEGYAVPLFLQFLLIEFAIDGLRMASLNTPSTLSNSFSVIGGLLLGEYAVRSGWFVPQTILYSAFTGIANFIPTNYELGYSFKFMRISLILLSAVWDYWGLLIGCILWLLLLISTRSCAGKGYLYPILPFDRRALKKILFRTRRGRERERWERI